MMHVRSTLAVSALILGGLVAASPFPYPREAETRPARTAPVLDQAALAARIAELAPAESPAATWVDPPAHAAASARAETAPAVAEPAPATVATAAPASVIPAAVQTPPSSRTETPRRRAAQNTVRARKTAVRQVALKPAPAETAPASPAPAPERRFDPITNLLDGLGLGRQG